MCIPINILVFENNNKASEALAKSNEMKVKLVTAQEMNNGYVYENKNFKDNVLVYPHIGKKNTKKLVKFLIETITPSDKIEVFFNQDYGFDFEVIDKEANRIHGYNIADIQTIEKIISKFNYQDRLIIKGS